MFVRDKVKYCRLLIIPSILAAAYHANSQSISEKKGRLLDSMTSVVTSNIYSDMNSILISQNGILNYERYFNGWNKDSLHDSRSSFKSITSLLTGIAVDKGLIPDVKQKVYSFFPEFKDLAGNNAWKKDMMIENLLRMESGFDCEEFNDGKDCEPDMTATKLFASGNGGQYIMIIERLGMVIVFTQGNYNSWKAKKAFDLLARFILPAFEK